MTYDQLNFVVAVSAKAESMTARMNEVFEVKLFLAQYFLNNNYKFAIVGEDIITNEQRLGAVCNLIISVVPQSEGVIKQIGECNALKTAMVDVISGLGYHCMIVDEGMMSDLAKRMIQYLPKADGQYYSG